MFLTFMNSLLNPYQHLILCVCVRVFACVCACVCVFVRACVCVLWSRTHANGSIKRGSKDNATESMSLRTGIGVQLKDIKVFNRARQQGQHEHHMARMLC